MAFVSVTLCVERINFMAACCADAPGKSSQTQFADFAETRLSTTNGHELTRIRVRRGADGRNSTPPPSRCDAHIPLSRPEGHPLPIGWGEGQGEGSSCTPNSIGWMRPGLIGPSFEAHRACTSKIQLRKHFH